jgi:PAS domain S-box-containing protein
VRDTKYEIRRMPDEIRFTNSEIRDKNMKIKTRLILNNWISLVVIVIMVLAMAWSVWELDRNDRNEKLVLEMRNVAFERISLRDDYLLHLEERAGIQWQAKSKTLRELLETAAERFKTVEEKAILQEARQNFDMTFSVFSAIMEKQRREGRRANKNFAFDEADSRLIGQIFLKAYALMDNIGRLYESTERKATSARNRVALLIIIFFVAGGIAIVINSTLLNRTLTKRLSTLTDGIKVIGDGNLDYQIVADADDELADLARSSNEMVFKLKQSYTSMENLRKEISERKKAEENIKKLSLHQQALLSAIPDIIMEVDVNKVYTWANEPGLIFFGEDVIGKPADLYFLREQNTYDVVHPIFNGSEDVIYVESWQRRKNGQERLLAWWCHVLKDAQGNVTGALSSARDVTDLKLEEERLLESEDKFKYMFDSSAVGKSITLISGEVSVNKAFAEMLGYFQEEINKVRWQDITHPDDVELTQREIDQMLSSEKDSARFIKRYIHKNGSVVWTDLSSSLRRDKDGKPLYLMSIMVNISDRIKAEEEITNFNEELEQRVAERTAELTTKTDQLERVNKVFVGRELRMRELKVRIAELEKKA